MKELEEWLDAAEISYDIEDRIITVNGFDKMLFIKPKDDIMILDDFVLNLSDDEKDLLEDDSEIKYIIFKWGNRFYYSNTSKTKNGEDGGLAYVPDFKILAAVGEYENTMSLDFINLGVHTAYELLNGSAEPDSWIKKAKFFKQTALGIADKNTMAGTLPLQIACEKAGIKPILGMTVSVAHNYSETKEHQEIFDVILYIKNEKGWRNLLRINKAINVDFDKFIPEKLLLEFGEGLICVMGKDSILNHYIRKPDEFKGACKKYEKKFDNLFYQLDFNEYTDDDYDLRILKNAKTYIDKYSDLIQPVYIPEAYYIEKMDSTVKQILNRVDRTTTPHSADQYFKSVSMIMEQSLDFTENSELAQKLFMESIYNTVAIAEQCNYKIETGERKLPRFEVDDPTRFYHDRLAEGFERKVIERFGDDVEKINKYMERLDEENDVIVNAGFVDYFLILWDVVKYCKEVDILVGMARGSAGGSLVAYLLDIIEIDPIEYDLLFERFLNKARVLPEIHYHLKMDNGQIIKLKSGDEIKDIKGERHIITDDFDFTGMETLSKKKGKMKIINFKKLRVTRPDQMPDIDIDFEGLRRQEIKRYMERKYGLDSVCSIGTFNRLKLKSALKDFGRVKGLDFNEMNHATKQIDCEDQLNPQWQDIFINAQKKPQLKTFVQNNVDICEGILPFLGMPRSSSVHASAVLILPKEDKKGNKMTIFDWLPVKKVDGVLVSEWEGKYVERAGFLKEDILSIAQLDKFKMMIELIQKNSGERFDFNMIPNDDPKTLGYFHKGWNEDVFQFGTAKLKNFSRMVRPDSVEDLISMNALHRPGPMKFNAHENFALMKHGKKKAVIDIGMKKVTEKTQGLYVYQEQIMQAMTVGGMTLAEADSVRTYMKKFDKVALAKFEGKFVKGMKKVIAKKNPKVKAKVEAKAIWDKLNAFSSYGFNRSHAAAYTVMGYWSQWMKVHYPLEFWTTSLNFADEKTEIPNRLSEITAIGSGIEVRQPDINKSEIAFTADYEDNIIYWSLSKVKNAGTVAVAEILRIRSEGGMFFSLDEFLKRVPKAKVNKRVVTSLIISGAFDQIGGEYDCPIESAVERSEVLKRYCAIIKAEVPEEYRGENSSHEWFWIMKQKEMTGFGDIDFRALIKKKSLGKTFLENYLSSDAFTAATLKSKWGDPVTIAGTVLEIKERNMRSKVGKMANVAVNSNNSLLFITFWADDWEKYGDRMKKYREEKTIFAISGVIKYDDYHSRNACFTDRTTKIYEI